MDHEYYTVEETQDPSHMELGLNWTLVCGKAPVGLYWKYMDAVRAVTALNKHYVESRKKCMREFYGIEVKE